jgi:hypothetical protein
MIWLTFRKKRLLTRTGQGTDTDAETSNHHCNQFGSGRCCRSAHPYVSQDENQGQNDGKNRLTFPACRSLPGLVRGQAISIFMLIQLSNTAERQKEKRKWVSKLQSPVPQAMLAGKC